MGSGNLNFLGKGKHAFLEKHAITIILRKGCKINTQFEIWQKRYFFRLFWLCTSHSQLSFHIMGRVRGQYGKQGVFTARKLLLLLDARRNGGEMMNDA